MLHVVNESVCNVAYVYHCLFSVHCVGYALRLKTFTEPWETVFRLFGSVIPIYAIRWPQSQRSHRAAKV